MPDKKFPLTIDVDLDDTEAIEEVAEALGTTPAAIQRTIKFGQDLICMAESKGLTKGQLVTALMSVVSMNIKECGDRQEQIEMAMHLFEGVWASLGLSPQFGAYLHSTSSDTVH